MRTTLDIDDEVLDAARAIVRERGGSLGAVVSELALRGLKQSAAPRVGHGFPTFAPAEGAAPITLDMVNAARDGGMR